MNTPAHPMAHSARVMRITGWMLILLPLAMTLYPPGFLWGSLLPTDICFPQIGPAHPASPYHALHPYLFMLAALYVSLGILFVRGARDPRANGALFDFGILSSLAHAGVMIPQSFWYPNEHAHLWADVPLLFVLAWVLWKWHPKRAAD